MCIRPPVGEVISILEALIQPSDVLQPSASSASNTAVPNNNMYSVDGEEEKEQHSKEHIMQLIKVCA